MRYTLIHEDGDTYCVPMEGVPDIQNIVWQIESAEPETDEWYEKISNLEWALDKFGTKIEGCEFTFSDPVYNGEPIL